MRNTRTVLSLAAILILGTTFRFIVGGASRPAYRFEQEPRPVLEKSGLRWSRNPKLAVSSSGVLYLLTTSGDGNQTELSLLMSHDGGDTFMAPVRISEAHAQVRSHGESSPTLVETPTAIYVLWEQNGENGTVDLMLARSRSFGRRFDKPVRVIDKTKPSFNGFSSLGVAPNGDVYVVWLDGRDAPETAGTFSLYLARSADRGATFEPHLRVSENACPCCRPQIAFGSRGELYVAWRRVFPGDIRDIVLSKSSDAGRSFLAPLRVAEDNWKINGCPDSGPAILRVGGRLYVAWLTEPAVGAAGIRLSWSEDSGKTFRPAALASQGIWDSNHPALSAGQDQRVLLVFEGRDPAKKPNWSPFQPWLVEIRPSGEPSSPSPLPGGKPVSYPTLAVGDAGRVFVAWTERNEKTSTVMLARGRAGANP
jgi:hypothetical protein